MNNSFFSTIAAFIKNNKFAVILTIAGIILAILFLNIGFWKTLLILVLAVLGCAAGIFFDRKIKGGSNSNDPFNFGD